MKIKFANGYIVEHGSISYYDDEKTIETVYLSTPIIIKVKNIRIKTKIIELYKSGKVQRCPLDVPQSIKTPIGRFIVNYITFYESGQIEYIIPILPETLGITDSSYHINTKYIIIDKNNKIQEREFDKLQKIKTPIGTFKSGDITFFKSGGINNCSIFGNTIIHTLLGELLVCNLAFYSTGELKTCELIEDSIINSPIGKIKVYDIINFYKNGNLKTCKLVDSQIIDRPKGKIELYDIICFHKNGKFKYGH